jgi:hypothetical protein
MPFWNSLIISRGHSFVTVEIWLDEIFLGKKNIYFINNKLQKENNEWKDKNVKENISLMKRLYLWLDKWMFNKQQLKVINNERNECQWNA